MGCQSRNRRPSAALCFQRPTPGAFHQPHPAAHRPPRYPEHPSCLGLRKTLLNGLDNSLAKVFLTFRRQRTSILLHHARDTNTSDLDCHLYYAPISKYCGAVAVSAYPPYRETAEAIAVLRSSGITTNIHFVLTSQSVSTAIEWLNRPPDFLELANAIVFLNYKPVGRHADEGLLLNKSPRVEEFFKLATSGRRRFRVGFDTCTITGLARFGNAPEISLEGCDAGRFSLFVSEKMEVYPCSFMVEAGYRGIPLKGSSLGEIWRNHSGFRLIRAKHAEKGCAECTTPRHCLSGCPLFPEMNLCQKNCHPNPAEIFNIVG